MRKGRLGVVGAALVLALAGPAAADTHDVFTFADPFDGSAECDGFDIAWEGHDRGKVTDFINGEGVPYREVGHIHSTETDTNLATGKSVVIRSNVTVHGALSPEGDLASWSITGEFNIGNVPGEGIVIHDSGMVQFGEDGLPVALHGIHDTFTKEDAFCEALD